MTTRVALIQMSMEPDTQLNLDKAAERVYEAARQGANLVCLPELFRAQYFCQREDHALFGLAESNPRPIDGRAQPRLQRDRRRPRRQPLRAPRPRPLPQQHRRHHRKGRPHRRHLPQDAHPRRSSLLREVLLHPRRPRLQSDHHHRRQNRHLSLLGTSGTPKARASPPSKAPRPSSSPPPSAGTPPKKRSSA